MLTGSELGSLRLPRTGSIYVESTYLGIWGAEVGCNWWFGCSLNPIQALNSQALKKVDVAAGYEIGKAIKDKSLGSTEFRKNDYGVVCSESLYKTGDVCADL